jgi:hypothetical protein
MLLHFNFFSVRSNLILAESIFHPVNVSVYSRAYK